MVALKEKKALFDLGRIVATPGVTHAIEGNHAMLIPYLDRHSTGDWGAVCEEDWETNNQSLLNGSRLLSAYAFPDGTKFWIITEREIDEEHHRYATTFLLPEEY